MARWFNPASVWTQVSIATKTAHVVKFRQAGTIALASGGANTNTATLSQAVTVANCQLTLVGFNTDAATATQAAVYLTLTNTTTVTVTRNNAVNTHAITAAYELVEYY